MKTRSRKHPHQQVCDGMTFQIQLHGRAHTSSEKATNLLLAHKLDGNLRDLLSSGIGISYSRGQGRWKQWDTIDIYSRLRKKAPGDTTLLKLKKQEGSLPNMFNRKKQNNEATSTLEAANIHRHVVKALI